MSAVCRSLRALLGASASRACGRIGQLKKVNLWQLGYGGLVPIVSLLRCRTEQKVAGASEGRPPARPGGLCLNGGGYAQDQAVGAAPTHELQPEREPIFCPSAWDRYCRLACEVERPRECPAHL